MKSILLPLPARPEELNPASEAFAAHIQYGGNFTPAEYKEFLVFRKNTPEQAEEAWNVIVDELLGYTLFRFNEETYFFRRTGTPVAAAA